MKNSPATPNTNLRAAKEEALLLLQTLVTLVPPWTMARAR